MCFLTPGRSNWYSPIQLWLKCASQGAWICSLCMFLVLTFKKETHVELITCFRCFSIEDHLSFSCTKDSTYKICSSCSAEGQDWRNCHASYKKCLNCHGNHHSLANQCPKRKEALKYKRENFETTKSTSSSIGYNKQIVSDKQVIDTSKSVSCILLSALSAVDEYVSFSDEINKLFKQNSFACLNLTGYKPPSLDTVRNFLGLSQA